MCKRVTSLIFTVLVAAGWMGTTAVGQVPDGAGLVFWLDASKSSSIMKDATGKVSRWNDLSGNKNYADQTVTAQQPTYVGGALSGTAVVDFGDSVYGNPLSTYQPWMQFRNASGTVLNISDVRTVFWVCGMDAGSNGFLLGDDNNYHFHRGQQQQIWDGANGWASANIRSGSTYLNGVKVDGTATVLPTDYSIISLVTTANVEASMLTRDRTYRSGGIKLAELLIYNRALVDTERMSVESYLRNKWFAPGMSGNPQPEDGATDVLRTTVLSWTPGEYPGTHDVYFGAAFADVNDASRADPRGVLVSRWQDANTYDPPGRFDFGRTYYWRIDEVNAPPDNTIFKGTVWSFTAESYSVPVANVKATASSSNNAKTGPEKTVDGSGLNAANQHSTVDSDMWLSGAASPRWIQYEFSRTVKLDQMLVWNSNQAYEAVFGFGAKRVLVDFSADGTTWTSLGEFEFARATGKADYTHNTTVGFGGAAAKCVKLTIQNNWSGKVAQCGLSEVRFLHVPTTAREPDPSSGAVNVAVQTALSWRPGREAGTHDVYLGGDPNVLSQAATVSEPSYEASLNLDQTYYWKVNEVNAVEDPAIWEGDVWRFSTQPYIVLDDFESYTNDSPKRLFQTWVDGLGFSPDDIFPKGNEGNGSGAIVGYDPLAGTIAETLRVNTGRQSMPLFYDNAGVGHSEAERTFAEPQDWTKHGIKTLTLAFHGDPNNTGQIYVKINDTKIVYDGKAQDITRTLWQPWNIDLAYTGTNLKSVTKLAIGIDGALAAGVLYVDDIRLYPWAGELVVPVDPGTIGLVAYYKFDGNLKDSAGSYHGTTVGDAKTVTDPVRGQVLSLDGIGDAVDVPLLGTSSAITISMWVNSPVDTTDLDFASFFHSDGWEAGDVHWRFRYGRVDGGFYGNPNLSGRSIAKPNVWYHVAATITPTEWSLWLDGLRDGVALIAAPAVVAMGDGLMGAWLGTDGVTITRDFTGKIDDVRFYNRALSQAEIAWLAGRTGPFAKPFN